MCFNDWISGFDLYIFNFFKSCVKEKVYFSSTMSLQELQEILSVTATVIQHIWEKEMIAGIHTWLKQKQYTKDKQNYKNVIYK